MGSETKREREVLWGRSDHDDTFGEPMHVTQPDDAQNVITPTPTADGAADFAKADAFAADWLSRGFASAHDDVNLCRAYLALRARPALPADVQAVVERVERSIEPCADDETFPDGTGYTFGYSADKQGTWVSMTVGDLRTLLAHLTRQDTP